MIPIKKTTTYPRIKFCLQILAVGFLILVSNLYLQWCQNDLSLDLALKFAFSWHTEKFFLACLVLLAVYGWLASLVGSLLIGGGIYLAAIGILGYADHLKMVYRQEPIYPDDLKMITQLGLLREMVGWPIFILLMAIILIALAGLVWSLYRSFKLPKKSQLKRLATFLLCSLSLVYASHFNDANNLLRKAYNRTALWIPYSQKMNYYNTGFIGGFLFNLRVEAMDQPADYSADKIDQVTKKYQAQVPDVSVNEEERPNIIYVMAESFSDPAHLKGLTITGDPLKDYYEVANQTYSGKMLSQNYGGGTANIEFEALTSFSMELLNPQMTTPYTMLVPKMTQLPSIVALLKAVDYQTTAIHPYDTSMYKRKDVYDVLGFDAFIDQDTINYTEKLQNNPYISDHAAYQQVMDLLQRKAPQFIHLVTMQTHMPYNGKYENIPYQTSGPGNLAAINNYLQDVAYSSEALKSFLEELKNLSRRTIVVFWGDHLPGIYADETQKANSGADLHQTQFLIYDSAGKLSQKDQHAAITSPFYFAPNVLEQAQQPSTGFYQLLLQLEKAAPAFEKNMVYQQGKWQKEFQFDAAQKELYQDYRLIQYDILAGKQYSLKTKFFTE